MIKYILTIFLTATLLNLSAQVITRRTDIKPIESSIRLSNEKISSTEVMPQINIDKLLEEDEIEKEAGLPFRFGYEFSVSYNLQNSGNWTETEGGRVWTLKIISHGAYSINLAYDKFNLPEKSELYIYNEDETVLQGPITSKNNTPNKQFASDLIEGSAIILEYFEPNEVKGSGVISISKVVHAYRNLFGKSSKDFGGSGSCNIDINCPQGNGWQEESNAVAMILVGNDRICSGCLINNTHQDFTPYLLTANHCVADGNVNNWSFRFQYKSPTCGGGDDYTYYSYFGANLRARSGVSDFALLELNERPDADTGITYAGWSRNTSTPSSATGIHHPRGDVMKISIDNNSPLSVSYNAGSGLAQCWRTVWDEGTTEPGSSGSPLFDNNQRIVGQLYGGTASCSNTNGHDNYGRFAVSWTNGLNNFLDPSNTGATTTNTISIPFISGSDQVCTSSSTFIVDNLPPETSVTWTSTSNISFPSGNTGASVSAQASSSFVRGIGWIEATLTSSNGSITLPRKDVWVGKPNRPLITGASEIGFYKLGKYISDSRFPGVWFFDNIFDWSYATIQKRYDYSCEIESKNESGEIYLYVEVENRCGTWRNGKSISINKNSGGGDIPRSINTDLLDGVELHLSIDTSSNETGQTDRALINMQVDSAKFEITDFMYMNILPNPANAYAEINFYKDNELSEYQKSSPTMVNIPLNEQTQEQGEYEIQIWNERKGLVKKLKSKAKKLQIPTNNLDEGLYFLHVIINGKVYKQKLRVKR